ncbi:MAG: hypothetical protein K8T20_12570 [Planctomycetes bacterium]|nr:hypothetical protein [Planctomycetota bacterium]
MFTFLVCVGLMTALPGLGALAAREFVLSLVGPDCDEGPRALLTVAASVVFGVLLVLATFAIPSAQFPAIAAICSIAFVAAKATSNRFRKFLGV